MNWRVEIPGLKRQEIPEIPVKALREAIINSFCHRDYYAPESNYIAIYKNRIEITNPGEFPQGLTPQDFIKGNHESILRNPLIADVLYKSKEIEHWGSGLKRIYDECHAHKVKVDFEIKKTGFAVVFDRPVEITKKNSDLEETSSIHFEGKSSEKSSEKILSAIKGNNLLSAKEIAAKIGLTARAVEKQLAAMKKKGLIQHIGPDKGGHWEVTGV